MIERSKIKEENMKKTNKFAIVVSVAVLVLTVLWLFIHQSFVSGFTGILWILGWGILVVSIIISFVISCACREKRAVWIDACCVLFILVSCIFLHQTPEPSETEIWERRETVVAEILSGELQADEMGTIELPDAEENQEYLLLERVVDEKYGNPLRVWHEMGEPANPTRAQVDLLRQVAKPFIRTSNVIAKDGVVETVKELKKRGYGLNVLTASPHLTLDPCLKRIGIFDCFDNCITA